MKIKTSPEQRAEQRIDALVICFCMSSFGIVSEFFSIITILLFHPLAKELAPWFQISLMVSLLFGLATIILFLTSTFARTKLFSLVRDVFNSED